MEFKDHVIKARLKLMYSQTELAAALGVSYPTVNRWEQGHHQPRYAAKRAFYAFCEKKGIRFEFD